jgi:REP element-mobilizing transposase RayT
MARPLRIEYDGAVYHVTSRGNSRADIFMEDSDRVLFLNILAKVVKRYNFLCHAYCLMDNHYHLLIETPDGNLSAGMRQLNGVYTQAFNRAHQRDGHLYKGRYKAILVEKEGHLLELSRYVVLNPVRATIVSQPEQYRWSSYLPTLGRAAKPELLTTQWILGNFSTQLDEGRLRYQRFVQEGIDQSESPWEHLTNQLLLGSEYFVHKVKSHLLEPETLDEIPRKQRYVGRPSLVDIFSSKPATKNVRNDFIRRAHEEYGYTLKEISSVLGIHYTTVSKAINTLKK